MSLWHLLLLSCFCCYCCFCCCCCCQSRPKVGNAFCTMPLVKLRRQQLHQSTLVCMAHKLVRQALCTQQHTCTHTRVHTRTLQHLGCILSADPNLARLFQFWCDKTKAEEYNKRQSGLTLSAGTQNSTREGEGVGECEGREREGEGATQREATRRTSKRVAMGHCRS